MSARMHLDHGQPALEDRTKETPAGQLHEFQSTTLHTARWVEADDPRELRRFTDAHEGAIADDWSGAPVYLAANPFV